MQMKGIILAGGKSKRFGEDKALAFWEGKTFLERAVLRIRELGLEPVVVTNRNRDYSFLNCRVERDIVQEKGPLGGLFTACHLFPDHSLLALTCDMPSISADLLKQLVSAHNSRNLLTVYSDRERGVYPFPGVYESDLRNRLQLRLEMGSLSMMDLINGIAEKMLIKINLYSPDFGNINTKTDFQKLVQK